MKHSIIGKYLSIICQGLTDEGHVYIYIYIYNKEDFAQQYDKCGARPNNYYELFEALKLIRIIYTVLMQNRSCLMRLSMLRPTPPLPPVGDRGGA